MIIDDRRLAALAVILSLGFAACDSDDSGGTTEPPGPAASVSYVGSETCGFCHSNILNEFRKSGHPYKLNKVENGIPPSYPFSDVPNPPAGVSWDDVAYVIGGFGWKARFIGQDGYIITQGGRNQWNLATEGWVDYHKDERKPYTCGPCHTTGYQADGNQGGLEGLVGTWALPGVHCEECHGPGSLHIENPANIRLSIDTRAESCGECHNRGGVNDQIPAKGGFIRHHEQYNEMTAGAHRALECVTCHDPHTGVKYNDQENAQAILTQCEDCHTGSRASLQAAPLASMKGDFACEDCHMPRAAKSAVANGTFVGDIRSHIVALNTDVDAVQFDGGFANPYLTLDFVCLGCHEEEDRAWAASYVDDVHGADFAARRSAAPLR